MQDMMCGLEMFNLYFLAYGAPYWYNIIPCECLPKPTITLHFLHPPCFHLANGSEVEMRHACPIFIATHMATLNCYGAAPWRSGSCSSQPSSRYPICFFCSGHRTKQTHEILGEFIEEMSGHLISFAIIIAKEDRDTAMSLRPCLCRQ